MTDIDFTRFLVDRGLTAAGSADTIQDLKKRYGTEDEDELILRATVPEADIAKMRAAGPVKTSYPLLSSPELERVRKLMTLTRSKVVEIKSAAMTVSLRSNGG